MAGAETVIGLGNSILQLVSTIQTLGDNYYKADAAWTGLELQIDHLKRRCNSWEVDATRFGLSEDNDLMRVLQVAKSTIEKEETKLRNSTRCSGCLFKLRGTVFPAQIGQSIQSVVDAFDKIPGTLEAQQAAKQLLRKERMGRSISLRVHIHPDSRYVPPGKTQSRVFQALENPQGPAVVLLCGGPGKGKSTLAAHVALHYEGKAKEKRSGPAATMPPPILNVAHTPNVEAPSPESLFEQVVYLECGPEADTAAKHLELLRRLDSDQGEFVQPEKDSGFKDQINRRLGGLLKDQKVLLILDDVWSPDLLWEMVRLCGENVKCLVTSQQSHLCQNIRRSEEIQIEEPGTEEAKKILASHIGLPDQQIPQHLQEIADQMIEKIGSNRLALASLAKAIDPKRTEDPKEWESASEDLYRSLDKEDIPAIHSGRNYCGNLWSSLTRLIGSLTDSALKLWILTSMCGASVPEGVVELLYESIQEKLGRFSSSRQELERIELIKINERKEEASGETRRSWALHFLYREYIGGHESLVKVAESLLSSLIDEEPCQNARADNLRQSHGAETTVVTALCALYMVDTHAGKAAPKLKVPRENFNVLRRSAIEPIVGLLERRSSKQQRTDAMQVFLEFICHRKLDDNGISQLLSLPGATQAVLKALEDIALVEESSLLGEDTERIMRTLVGFLGDESHQSRQEAASSTLLQFSYSMSDEAFIVSFPGVLDVLVKVIREEHVGNPKVQVNCVSILASLAYADDCAIKIIRHPGVLTSLSRIFLIDSSLELRSVATWVLGNIAASEEGAAKVMQIEGLVKVVELNSMNALKLLANLAIYFPEEIANLPGVLTRLASLLHDPHEEVVEEALRGLRNVCRAEGPRGHVKAREGVIEALVAKLVDGVPFRVQHWTVGTLANLAIDSPEEIANLPGVLTRLVSLLHDPHEEVAEQALRGLYNVCRAEGPRGHVKAREGVIEALLAKLVDGVPSRTQEWAVGSLTYVDPTRANQTSLHSGSAWKRRGIVNFELRLYDEALGDLNVATHLLPEDLQILSYMCLVKVKKGDFQGALIDINKVLEGAPSSSDRAFYLQERGVLKRMMGDLVGALADLDEGLDLEADDYERLKHRGYVKFLMGDHDGAHADAQWALRVKPTRVDAWYHRQNHVLGTTSVEYLQYKLK